MTMFGELLRLFYFLEGVLHFIYHWLLAICRTADRVAISSKMVVTSTYFAGDGLNGTQIVKVNSLQMDQQFRSSSSCAAHRSYVQLLIHEKIYHDSVLIRHCSESKCADWVSFPLVASNVIIICSVFHC